MHPETIALWTMTGICCLLLLWIGHLVKSNGRLVHRIQHLSGRDLTQWAKIRDLERENAELKKMMGV